jgi:hypothetical protein
MSYLTTTKQAEAAIARVEEAAPYLVPIIEAVRDGNAAFGLVLQGSESFEFPADYPAVIIIGDDLHEAFGPAAFDRASLARLFRNARAAAVVACEPLPKAYDTMLMAALAMRGCAVIVETQPEREAEWMELIHGAACDLPLILATVVEGNA